MTAQAWVGTSGWIYRHWRGVFYPQKLGQSHWFDYFARHFRTVEINNTFYMLPAEQTFDRWRERAPQGFVYTLKASRLITHSHRLHNAAHAVDAFLSRARLLGDHLGPILYQLPPHFDPDPERLDSFARLLPQDLVHVFEFRDPRWFNDSIREVLTRYNLSFCIYDMPGIECPSWVSGPIAYLRFHGSAQLYAGRYTKEQLKKWAKLAKSFLGEGRDVYAYFNNDMAGNAIYNAQELEELLDVHRGTLRDLRIPGGLFG